MISKPRNNAELAKLIGKQVVIDNWPGVEIKGKVTGISCTKNENPHAEGEFHEVFLMINYKPKSHRWQQVKEIVGNEIEDQVDSYKALPKWLPVWLAIAAVIGYIISDIVH